MNEMTNQNQQQSNINPTTGKQWNESDEGYSEFMKKNQNLNESSSSEKTDKAHERSVQS
jgi:hypothetical protein